MSSIQLVDGGRGYSSAPAVVFTGGTPTVSAEGQAVIGNGQVLGVRVSKSGSGYQAAPLISFTGSLGEGGDFVVNPSGAITGIRVAASGSGYTSAGSSAAAVTVSTSNGLTDFAAVVTVTDGKIVGAEVISGGTGATTTPTLALTGIGTGATLLPSLAYSVVSVSVGTTGGTGYQTPPFITVRPDPADTSGSGCELDSTINASGSIDSVSVISGGQYTLPPSALIVKTEARAQASLALPLRGKYLCGIRYIDATPASKQGPIPSSISHLVEVEAREGKGGLDWTFTHSYVDDRVSAMELWRTSADQSIMFFRVATIQKTDPEWNGTYVDEMADNLLTDARRDGYGLMPITLPSGQVNARRFGVPPGRYAVAVMFQDRAWYAVDTSGERPNSLYFSAVDEPESVSETDELVVQENTDYPDSIVALVPLGSMLLIVQSAHIYRLMYVAQPVIDASIMLVARRGVLNNRCWGVLGGVAFMADTTGVYGFDGAREDSVSVAVDNYWRDGIIDFTKSDKFHVDADSLTRTVRFYYCRAADAEPVRALCFCVSTKAWWEEEYAQPVTASTGSMIGGQLRRALGGGDCTWRKESGTQDGGTSVPYSFKTGNLALLDEPDRAISVVYKPTESDSTLNASLFYNNSSAPRNNAIHSDPGGGFTVTQGGPASLNLKKTRSALGDATGLATAHYSGRKSDRSAGGDQHVALQVSGNQTSDSVVIYGLKIEGAS